jgi:hypothetical protein
VLAPPAAAPPELEHLTPHDLVTYSRCPHEMELAHARHRSLLSGTESLPRTPADVVPLRHSPLFTPLATGVEVVEGRLDVDARDRLIYVDEGEENLPVLFAPEQTAIDPRFRLPGSRTLIDRELGLAGRPDWIVRRVDGALVPIEYKSTHLFSTFHDPHGRPFDHIQAIAECRLVHATWGERPPFGLVLYGDQSGDGQHEGWVRVPYGEPAEHWLRASLALVRADRTRAPVPAERTCSGCGPNREGLCRFAACRPDGAEPCPSSWNRR